MEATTRDDAPVYRRMSRLATGPVSMARILSVPQSVEALLEEMPSAARESTQLQLVRTGSLVIEQGERRAVFGAGDLAVYDASRPFRFRYPEAFTTTIVQVPTELLGAGAPGAARRAGRGTTGRRLLEHMLQLAARTPPLPDGDDRLSERIVDAARLIVGAADGEPPGTGARWRADVLRRAVMDDLHRSHRDPSTSVAAAAARLGVSVRQVHAAFEDAPDTAAGTLRRLRHESARRLLRESDLPIAEVAAQVGYLDTTAFIRSWTSATGTTPARWRRLGRATLAG
ncbi:AraC family transcriptional regulator [Microbacterium sp. NPDC091313]